MSIRRKERIQNGAVKNLSTSIMADTFHSEELFGTMNPQYPLVTFVWECACTSTIGMYLDTMPFLIAPDYFKLGNISNKEVSKAYTTITCYMKVCIYHHCYLRHVYVVSLFQHHFC